MTTESPEADSLKNKLLALQRQVLKAKSHKNENKIFLKFHSRQL